MSDDKKKSRVFIKKDRESVVENKNDDFYEYDRQNSKSNVINESDYDYFDKIESIDYGKLREEKERQEQLELLSSEKVENTDEIEQTQTTEYIEDVEFDKNSKVDSEVLDSEYYAEKKEVENIFENELYVQTTVEDKKDIYNSLFDEKDFDLETIRDVEENKNTDVESNTVVINAITGNSYDFDDEDDDYGVVEGYQQQYIAETNLSDIYDEKNYEDDDEEETISKPRKKKKKKKKSIFRVFLKAFILFLLCCSMISVYFALTHDLFKIDYIDITGNVTNSKEILEQKIGVNIGDNIFLVSKSSVVSNLKTIPTIEDVKVSKDLPNILRIELKEKYVSSFINNNSGITTIDNYGKVQEINKKVQETRGIQLKGLSVNGLEVGNDFTKDKAKKDMLLDLITREYFLDIVSIDFSNEKEIVMEIKRDLKIQFGDINDFSKKLDIISVLLSKIEKEGINASEIILNVGDNPIIVKK